MGGYSFFQRKEEDIYVASSYNKGKEFFIQDMQTKEVMGRYKVPEKIYAKYEKLPKFGELDFQAIEASEDGGYLLIAQQHYDTSVTRYTSDNSYEDEIDYFNDFFIIKVDENFKQIWATSIPHKLLNNYAIPKVRTPLTIHSNYELMRSDYENGTYYLFYYILESPKIEITESMSKKERKKALKLMKKKVRVVYCDVVNEADGSFETVSLFSTKKIGVQNIGQFKFNRLRVLADKSIIGEVYKGDKEDILIKCTVE